MTDIEYVLNEEGIRLYSEITEIFNYFIVQHGVKLANNPELSRLVFMNIRDKILSIIIEKYREKKFTQMYDFISSQLEMEKRLRDVNQIENPIGTTLDKNDNYISVVIPYYQRIHYLQEIIDSIYEYADMPVEIIIHEDGSPDDTGQNLYSYFRNLVTTIISNMNVGHNLGLAVSANRAIKLATSKYIVFLNSDCKLIKPCFVKIKDTLDKEYVGYICLGSSVDEKNCNIINNSTKFCILPGMTGGSAMAFRKDFWEIIGGFDENLYSGSADTPLFYKNWLNGYFKASILDGPFTENMSLKRKSNADTTIRGTDVNFPKIFGITEYEYTKACSERSSMCRQYEKEQHNIDGGMSNISYWDKYSGSIFNYQNNELVGFHWDKAIHGQEKWKEQIEKDLADYKRMRGSNG